jgi:hypothetical protein
MSKHMRYAQRRNADFVKDFWRDGGRGALIRLCLFPDNLPN